MWSYHEAAEASNRLWLVPIIINYFHDTLTHTPKVVRDNIYMLYYIIYSKSLYFNRLGAGFISFWSQLFNVEYALALEH